MASFSVDLQQAAAGTILHLRGVIDAHTTADFEKALNDLIGRGHTRNVIDFSGVDYVASSGFGALLGAVHGFRLEGADVKVTGMSDSIRRIFDMLGFARVLDVCPTVDIALGRFDTAQAGSSGHPTGDAAQ